MFFEVCCLPESSSLELINSRSDFRWRRCGSHVGPVKCVLSHAIAAWPGSVASPHSSVRLSVSFSAGYILALGPLVFVSVFDVWLAKFTTRQAYIVNLVSVGVVAFGCTGTNKHLCFLLHAVDTHMHHRSSLKAALINILLATDSYRLIILIFQIAAVLFCLTLAALINLVFRL